MVRGNAFRSRAGEEARDEVRHRVLAALGALVLFGGASFAADDDEAIIRRLATRFAETWNAHDMAAMADLFADDADFVNIGGMHLKGREQIRSEHVKLHAMQFKESVLTIRGVSVRFPAPSVAIAHVEWAMKGDRDSDGTSRRPREGLATWTLVKRAGDWRIVASHNTNRVQEVAPK